MKAGARAQKIARLDPHLRVEPGDIIAADSTPELLLLLLRHLLSLMRLWMLLLLLTSVFLGRILHLVRPVLMFIPLTPSLLLPIFIRPLRVLLRRLRVFLFGLRFHIRHKSPFGFFSSSFRLTAR